MKKAVLYTVQLYAKVEAEKLNLPVYDITVKTGIKSLAPDWDFLMAYKESDKSITAENEYVRRYYEKLRVTIKYDRDTLLRILSNSHAVLACYCHESKFCHRHLAVSALIDVGARHGIRVIYGGELVRGGNISNYVGLDVPRYVDTRRK